MWTRLRAGDGHLQQDFARRFGFGTLVRECRLEASKAFDCEDNALLVLWRDGGRAELPRAPKLELAAALVGLIAAHYQ